MLENYRLRNYNFKLVILVVFAAVFGTVMINSADSSYLRKQVFGVVICMTGLVVLSLIDYKFIRKFHVILYGINVVLLLAVVLFGSSANGATRWLGSSEVITVQPSEFTKIFMIICAAHFLSEHKDSINTVKTLVKYAVLCAIPLILILMQPDLSTTIDIFIILFVMVFVAGLSYKIIAVAVLCMIPLAGSFLWYIQQPNPLFFKDYQIQRILAFLYPDDYTSTTQYQQDNSVMAIGSGQLFGKGLNSSTLATVKDANLISEQQTDFIFSVIGEELGFVGSTLIIVILGLIVVQCIKTARKANDDCGMLIATGVATLIGFQTFINIGVATSLLPNTGIPLPFISYGLSSLVSSCAAIGLVLNVSLQRRKY
ncbi:MAG: rod shape-determining protein RodA [Bacteroidales bacterium]|nr:rod shape-determining protein RodA [Clostridium sp.]MCM1204917.1 rod shape-determining protein RodA [Bacteroidales bacterium]